VLGSLFMSQSFFGRFGIVRVCHGCTRSQRGGRDAHPEKGLLGDRGVGFGSMI